MKLFEVNPHDHPLAFTVLRKLLNKREHVWLYDQEEMFDDQLHEIDDAWFEPSNSYKVSVRPPSGNLRVIIYSKDMFENHMDIDKPRDMWILKYDPDGYHATK